MSQKMPAHFQAKVDSFRELFEKQVTEYNETSGITVNEEWWMDQETMIFLTYKVRH